MRVAIVSPYDLDVPGGVQAHVVALAEALRAGGDTVTTLAPGSSPPPGVPRGAGGHVPLGGSVRVRFNGSVAPVALFPPAARRTVRALARLAPDVVHVHEPAVPWVGLAAATRSPAPAVGTFHAWSDDDRLYRLARPLLRRVAGGLADRIAVSPAAAEYHARALGVPQRSFTVVPNGVDVGRFAGASPLSGLRERGDGAILLFVGRLEERKGLEHLVRAFPILKTTRPDLRLVVVGEGPERDRVQALLPPALRVDVDFLGRVETDDLPALYAACDVFVAPSLGGESFGIVLIEAMAAGAPVVASDIPGYASVVTDGVTGRLVPPGDARALAAALDTLLANPSLRRALADEARARVDAYDWPAVAARVRARYEAVLTARATDEG
ncbi:MAG: glycosyltransferase family 4 protein [Actinomycetes bacterium]